MSVQVPSSRWSETIKFLRLLIVAELWKNLVLRSPYVIQFIRGLWCQKISNYVFTSSYSFLRFCSQLKSLTAGWIFCTWYNWYSISFSLFMGSGYLRARCNSPTPNFRCLSSHGLPYKRLHNLEHSSSNPFKVIHQCSILKTLFFLSEGTILSRIGVWSL
jgi:hypothetical protein